MKWFTRCEDPQMIQWKKNLEKATAKCNLWINQEEEKSCIVCELLLHAARKRKSRESLSIEVVKQELKRFTWWSRNVGQKSRSKKQRIWDDYHWRCSFYTFSAICGLFFKLGSGPVTIIVEYWSLFFASRKTVSSSIGLWHGFLRG